jgi:hypothetical protein
MATSIEQAYEIVNENSMVGLQTSQKDDESIENDPEYVADTIIDAQAYVMDRRHLTGMPYNNKYQMQEIRQDIREYLQNSFDDDMDPAVIESAAGLADSDNAHAASDVAEHMAKEMRESSEVGLQTSQNQERRRDRSKDIELEYAAETILDAQAYAMQKRHLTSMPYHHEDELKDIENDIRDYIDMALWGDQKKPEMLEAAARISDEDNAHFAASVAEKMAKEMRESSDPRSPRYWGLENEKPSSPVVVLPKHEQKKPEPMFPKKVKLVNAFPSRRSNFVFNPDISGVVKPPVHNDNNGYMGGHRFIGGKYDETHMLAHKDVAKLIRSDVKALKKNSSMPDDWKVSVKTVTYAGGMHYDINISVPEDSGTPLYRTPTFDDYAHGNVSGSIADDIRKDGIDPYNTGENEYNAFMNRHKDNQYRVLTDDARHARDAVQEVADQYKMSDVNDMVDYSSVHRSSDVRIRNEYKD